MRKKQTMATEFFDRIVELQDLKEKYDNLRNGEFCIVYGRRRLGKSLLIEKFLKDIKGQSVYYFVNKANQKELLSIMSGNIFDQTGVSIKFEKWEDFFDYLYENASKSKFIFVMDEFPRIKDISPDFITKLQYFWDSKLKNTKIMFIAIGSSISMMHEIFLDPSAPLYGRMTLKMLLKPFRYADFREMFKGVPEDKMIRLFSIFGGTPQFLWFVKDYANLPLNEIIEKVILRRTAPLREEPLNFITMELKKENNYNAVLHAISTTGGSRGELINTSGVADKDIDYYLNNLVELLSIVRIRTLLFHNKGSKQRYKFADNYFNFWYRYIYPNLSILEVGNIGFLLEKINLDIDAFVGKKFEEIIEELLVLYNGKKIKSLEINFTEIGSWWGKNRDGGNEEIEILANNKTTRNLIICEVKYQNQLVGISEIKKLIKKSEYINATGSFQYLFVSKSGFTKDAKGFMDEKNINYLDLDDISKLFNVA